MAEVQEASAPKAVLRMLLGHLCGFLRADYKIKGRVESTGYLFSQSRVFTYFRGEIDKPEAIESDIMLITSAVIFMRDRDKAHPWVN